MKKFWDRYAGLFVAMSYIGFFASAYIVDAGYIPRKFYVFPARINPAFLYMLVSAPFMFLHLVYLAIKKPLLLARNILIAAIFPVIFCFFNPQFYKPLFFTTLKTESAFPPRNRTFRRETDSIIQQIDLMEKLNIPGTCDVILPPDYDDGRKFPLIFRPGHPAEGRDSDIKRLLSLYASTETPCIFVRSGILDHMPEKYPVFSVSDEKIFREVAPGFPPLIETIIERYPVDRDKIIFTGFSMDGVYSWMLALEYPDIPDGVLALSVVSYPALVQNRLEIGRNIPTIILRGQRDWMFPLRFAQEMKTGAELMKLNPASEWVLVYGARHADVQTYWPKYLNKLL